MSAASVIQVFEHQILRVGQELIDAKNGSLVIFTKEAFEALEVYYGWGKPFFSLLHRGVKFNEYVGVLQVGRLTIEVLPKADNGNESPHSWQQFLIAMLRASGVFPQTTGTASLRLKSNSILDLYLRLFLAEVQYLMQTGLVRKYRRTEGNSTALKGSLQFAQNIRHNAVHAERFYVRHAVYDRNHLFNTLLWKGLELVKRISTHPETTALAAALLLDFPECSDVKISEALFRKLHFDRKTAAYQNAIGMAKLLLLRFHPDVQKGSQQVLALMFNMNVLWEKYVFRRLQRALETEGLYVREQVSSAFWQPEGDATRVVKPDIVVYDALGKNARTVAVLDTKWKCITDGRIADADLKQMLVYNLYNHCRESALLYPATVESRNITGKFFYRNRVCHALFLPLLVDANQGLRLNLDALVEKLKIIRASLLEESVLPTAGDTGSEAV